MKLKKKSGLMGAVIALSAASLVSVGFASWVISQGDTATLNDGTIVVDQVDDDRHMFEAAKLVTEVGSTTDAASNVVAYGTSSKDPGTWLSDTDGTLQNLTFYLYVKVANVNASDAINDVITTKTLTSNGGGNITINETTYTGYDGAASAVFGKAGASGTGKTLVGALPSLVASADNFNANGEAWFTINFLWGTLTGGANPYDYYNPKDVATYGDEAAESLSQLHTLLTGAKYIISLATI